MEDFDFFGWNKTYFLLEWEPPGPCEASTPQDREAPPEENWTIKAEITRKNRETIQKDSTHCVGGFAFYRGSKYEHPHTFYSLGTQEVNKKASVNDLESIWSGKPSDNFTPKIDSRVIHDFSQKENLYLPAYSLFRTTIYVQDAEN